MAVNGETIRRNPGPGWGFAFLRGVDRWMPRPLFRAALAMGASVAFLFMGKQRARATEYWQALTGEKPSVGKLWRQFFAFAESMMEALRMGRGERHQFYVKPGGHGEALKRLAQSDRPALFGSFHVGNSDLLGYALAEFGRQIHMIRIRVDNSDDTRWMGEQFGKAIHFIWVDRPESMLFALKEAVEAGHSIAMKCDRIEQSGRQEAFQFLGKERLFPFTIYHFSLLFEMPVIFAVGWPEGDGRTEVTASRVFEPDLSASREANLDRAREHFQEVLTDLETKLAAQPHLWFNFIPLNPEMSAESLQRPLTSI